MSKGKCWVTVQFILTLPRLQSYLRKRIPTPPNPTPLLKIQWRSIKCKRRSSGVAKKIKWRSIKCKRRSSGVARDRCSIIPTPPHPTPPPLLKIQWRSIKCKRRSSGVAEKIKWRSIKCKRRSSGVARDRCSIIPTPPHPTPPPLLKIQWRSIKCKRRSSGVAEKITSMGKINNPSQGAASDACQ